MERPLPVAASLQVFCVKEHEVEEIFELHLLPIDTANCFRTIIALETKFFICEFYMLSISWSKITWVTVFLRRNVVGDWRFDKLCENHLHSQVITFNQLKIGKPDLIGASTQVVETSVANSRPSQDSSLPDDLFQSRYVTPGFKPFSYYGVSMMFSSAKVKHLINS